VTLVELKNKLHMSLTGGKKCDNMYNHFKMDGQIGKIPYIKIAKQ